MRRMNAMLSAEDRLRGSYGRLLAAFLGVGALAHTVVIFFLVTPQGAGYQGRAEELEILSLPPEIQIPPPPEEIARPATPVIAQDPESVEEDVTIAETDIRENQPVPEAPPPPQLPVEQEIGNRFSFTPYTVAPRCKSGCKSEDVLRFLPPLVKRSGVECVLTVGIRIDTHGRATASDILVSSGQPACDDAARKWAMGTAWTVAYNRDLPVAVWIAQPLTIESI